MYKAIACSAIDTLMDQKCTKNWRLEKCYLGTAWCDTIGRKDNGGCGP